MSNRIKSLSISDDLIDPTHAEVSFRVYTERVTNKTEIRGRLMGPRCAYSSTVEVAYPVRMVKHEYGKEDHPYIASRVIIPEPCFWEPESPFFYQGIVELWQTGEIIEERCITRALRDIKLGPRGLHLNGKRFTLRGVARNRFEREELPELRRANFDTLLTPVTENCVDLCAAADYLGFFIIWRVRRRECFRRLRPLNLETQTHPSLLGGVVMPDAEEPEVIWLLASASFHTINGSFVGWCLTEPSSASLPDDCRFILCAPNHLSSSAGMSLPRLVLCDQMSLNEAGVQELSSAPSTLGWIIDQSK